VARHKDFEDNAAPSGNSVAAGVLQRLAALTGDERYRSYAETLLLLLRDLMVRYPQGFGHVLSVLENVLARPLEVAIVGEPGSPATWALLGEVRSRFLPQAVLALAPDDEAAAALGESLPLLAGRVQIEGRPTAYVCEHFACQMPVTEQEALAGQLDGLTIR